MLIKRKISRFLESRIWTRAGRRRDRRGQKGMSVDLLIATALMYLATGNTYESTALIMRNGMSKASVICCVRVFTRAVATKIAPGVIKFPTTLAGLARNARYFEDRSFIPNIMLY